MSHFINHLMNLQMGDLPLGGWLFLALLTSPVWLYVAVALITHDCPKDGQCPICDKEF